jgi:nucleotide-binding universal stress UspA family protein
MFRLDKILVPVDFSESSLAAVGQAGTLARHFHSEVVLLHVDDFAAFSPVSGPLGVGITSWAAVQAEEFEGRQIQLKTFGTADLSDVKTRRIVCSGDPAQVIVRYATNEKPDLVVIPTHGGTLRRFFLGSVTAEVLKSSKCPIWTGTHLPDAGPQANFRQVTCAVDFGSKTLTVLQWAADFAKKMDAKLTAVHVVPSAPPGLPEGQDHPAYEDAHFSAEECLRASLLSAGVEAEVQVIIDGDIAKAVSSSAAHTDLLVIGRSWSGGTEGKLGTHAYPIICGAPCPVVSI